MRNREYDHLFKYVIVGNSSVGKSCFLLRFADDQFSQNYMTTIGVDFRFKTIKVDEKNVKLQIWDTAGQERFRTITNTYYKNAHAVVMVYDITNMESFEDINKYWLNEVQSYADPDTMLILVGNKSDLQSQRTVSTDLAMEFAKSRGMQFFQTSAKTAQLVNQSFIQTTKKLITKLESQKGKKSFQKQQNRQQLNPIQVINANNKKGCC